MQSVGLASSAPAASSHVTVQVEGHVTPGRESAASDVLQASTGMSVTSVRQKLFQLNVHQFLKAASIVLKEKNVLGAHEDTCTHPSHLFIFLNPFYLLKSSDTTEVEFLKDYRLVIWYDR